MMLVKRIMALLLITALFLSMTGCHGAKNLSEFSMPDKLDENKQYEITFWAKNDTNKTQTNIYEKAIADFEKLYPNIKVTMKRYTDYGRIYNDVITNIPTNTTPNVCITYPDHIATYLTGKNTVVPLDELINDEQYGLGGSKVRFDSVEKDEVIKKYLDECKLDGKQYAIPFMRSTEACYVNKTYVEKLGYEVPDVLTWDFIWEVSAKATEKNEDGTYKVNGQKVLIPFIYKSTDNMMIQMLKQKGADYSNENGDILLFNDTAKELLYAVADSAAIGAFSTFKISSYPGNFFNAGQCIFAIDSTAGSTWIGSDAPLMDISKESVASFETEVRTVPQFDAENPVMISQGPSICIFNKRDSQEVLASWLFAQFLLTNDVQIAYAETEGYVPVTTKAQNDSSYIDYLARGGEDNDLHYSVKISATKLLIDNIDNTFVTPAFNGSASLRDAAGDLIENVTKSKRRKETVDDAYLVNLFSKINTLYKLDQNVEYIEKTKDLGPLGDTAKYLLYSIAGAWVLIFAYALFIFIKRKRNRS